jgi:hypothetical protein
MECNAAIGFPCYNSDNERMEGVHDSRGDFPTYDTLRAENERLRGAFTALLRGFEAHLSDQTNEAKLKDARLLCPCWETVIDKARAALGGGGE